MRSLPPMGRLRHMLPCLEAVEGGRGRLGHRSPFSTCQCARSDGASTGVDPQKERRAPAANWFRQVMIMPRRTPVTARPSTLRSKRECKTFEEIKVSNALELVLWATDFD